MSRGLGIVPNYILGRCPSRGKRPYNDYKCPRSATSLAAATTITTYHRRRLRADDCLHFLQHLWRELRQNLEGFKVIQHLLGLARAEDDRRRVLLRAQPREREVLHLAVALCGRGG